jgi:hypothetical protein
MILQGLQMSTTCDKLDLSTTTGQQPAKVTTETASTHHHNPHRAGLLVSRAQIWHESKQKYSNVQMYHDGQDRREKIDRHQGLPGTDAGQAL